MYKHYVEGTYITAGRIKEIHPYATEFDLAEGDVRLARAIIQNGLIKDWGRKNLNNFSSIRTCQVVDTVETEGEAENAELEELLTEATNLGCMPPNYTSLRKDETRMKALSEAITKKKAKIAQIEKKQKKPAPSNLEGLV